MLMASDPGDNKSIDINGRMPGNWRAMLFVVVMSFAKNGPWALLTIMILGGVGYELNQWSQRYVGAQADFIRVVAKSLDRHQEKSDELAANLKRAMENQAVNSASITKLVQQFDTAHSLMAGSPARAERMLLILEQLEVHAKTQTEETKAMRTALEALKP